MAPLPHDAGCPGHENFRECNNFSCRHNGCQGRMPAKERRPQRYVWLRSYPGNELLPYPIDDGEDDSGTDA